MRFKTDKLSKVSQAITNKLPENVASKAGRVSLRLKKNSPEILLGVGLAGMVTSTVLACGATLKIEEVVDEHNAVIDQIKEAITTVPEKYTEEDAVKDKALLHVKTATKVCKLYAPAIVVGGVSASMIIGSHRIMSKRNAALVAAYAALDDGFRKYRERVVDAFGVEQDQKFRYGFEEREITTTDENGKETKKTVETAREHSIYARFFDDSSSSWQPGAELNRIYLQCKQNYMNDLLRIRGHVFLNEVYDALGLERSTAGSVVGWLRDGDGDGYIDFGIFRDDYVVREFVNGKNDSILLDFNVDGTIYDKIEG